MHIRDAPLPLAIDDEGIASRIAKEGFVGTAALDIVQRDTRYCRTLTARVC